MKKIELKLNIEQLDVINRVIIVVNNQHIIEMNQTKMIVSIIHEVYEKLAKKAISERKGSKDFKVSFKYHEAYALERLLRMQLIAMTDHTYESNVIMNVANELHKQL